MKTKRTISIGLNKNIYDIIKKYTNTSCYIEYLIYTDLKKNFYKIEELKKIII